MAKPDQVLVIDPPNELTFYGPFTSAVSSVMHLTNPSEDKVCFKIKTTAPKRYCVKPNSGVIDPREKVQISVSLQPFEYDPAEKNRHKFMVQSMVAPDGEINQDTLWKDSDPSHMMDSKLKCVFVLPANSSGGSGFSGMENNGDDASVKSDYQTANQAKMGIPPSPKNASGSDVQMSRSIEEVKKLQEEVSTLRQENIQLKEEALRQKRLAANRNPESDSLSSGSSGGFSSGSGGAGQSGFSSINVTAANPNANALSAATLYAAVIVLILGVILGKWVF